MENIVYSTENKDLKISLEEKDDCVYMIWEGKCTLYYPGQFLDPIFERAMSLNDSKIIMNFENLEYMISSGFGQIVKIMDKIKNGTGRIELQYSKNVDWQELSFTALTVFCTPDNRVSIVNVA